MGLKANICQVCGGALKNCGTYYKCICCDTEFRIDDSMTKAEVEAYFDRLNDFADAERNLSVSPPKFDDAESEFELIVQKYPDWSAGYWGLVRAKFGIKFEQDLSGKAVPSCYKSTYEDFRNTDEYKKAIALAETNELRQSYEKMAEYIAHVAKEWREEAQKYDYDVFISFKASNDSDGSETRDAREMHKLYDLLKDKGYRVFFSPVTLITDGVGGKGSEPYIFNALDKAKALIVYGSRKEYFSSTWVQNEWQRYLRAIKAGKKEKDSLLVLYEGFNPKELPQGLRRIQGIEYGISAYPAVLSALERVFRKEDAARNREQELRRAEEEKRKAEQENAQKMQDMMAQLAVLQAELTRIKSTPSAVPQSAPVTNTSASATVKQNSGSQQITTDTKVIKPSATKPPLSSPAPVSEKSIADPYHGQNKDDFDIKNGILKKYKGRQREVIVPNGVTSIGRWAFYGCSGLTSITIPNGVTSIGENAFNSCSGLTSITIPNGVTSIGENAFDGCSGLTSITLPNSVKSIGDCAFSGCSGLTNITIPNRVARIGFAAFSGCSGLTSISIPNSVTSIEKYAFSGCSGLASIMLPDSVMSIEYSAFSGCSGLASIVVNEGNTRYYSAGNCIIEKKKGRLVLGCKSSTIPADGSVTSIGEHAFSGCSGLTSITIPDSVTSIESFAFSGCSGLTNIIVNEGNTRYYSAGNCIIEKKKGRLVLGCKSSTIPADGSVTSIGEHAFSGCSGLTSITIPDSVTSIESFAFSGCSGLTNIIVNEGNTRYYSAGNCIIEKEKGRLVLGCKSSTIPVDGSVKSIGNSAFSGCSGLASITIPSSVTSIGGWAFYNCSGLANMTIPNSVTSIGDFAFADCNGLTSITIPDSVTSIGKHEFSRCSGLTSITIPNSVTSIGDFVFSGCSSLKKALVPKETKIGVCAFPEFTKIERY